MRPNFTPSPELYPFESRWLDSSAGRLHYIDEGSGTPLLLLHGNPSWSFLYRHIVRELRDRFRCIAVDYPGFGLSERPAGYGYTPAEHARVVGELVDALDLDGFVLMGHDWGGPIGLSLATERADRVAGLVLGNTWFWRSEARARVFSAVMSSPPLQWAILHRNFFVERLMFPSIVRDLSAEELEHYRAVQPTAELRVGVAQFPRQIVAAEPWLQQLSREVPGKLGTKRTLLTIPLRDPAWRAQDVLPRMRATFADARVVELPEANHYFQEDASPVVAAAIADRFG
jgi:haloalkane dehalogenase